MVYFLYSKERINAVRGNQSKINKSSFYLLPSAFSRIFRNLCNKVMTASSIVIEGLKKILRHTNACIESLVIFNNP